ncbi:hypothetical protein HYALB_00008254 [Hymenoscyphus albidus]|uniref:Uncharacterized protein n=1 Tax=Hymenoscyphus albidus TaxID=595503 RepID=A0A9N9LJM4_9HELO|nr:hypothetical protein HYALB_00008254 [Hymenoscyphus albidus]
MPPGKPDSRVKLHQEVLKSHIELPAPSSGACVVAIHDDPCRYPIRLDKLLVLIIEEDCTVEDLQEHVFEKTGRRHIFRDGRDYLMQKKIIKAVDYFNDGIISLQAFKYHPKLRPSNMICPTISNGESRASLSECMDRLQEKYPDDRFEAFKSQGARFFQCHDCLTKVFRPSIPVQAMERHLEDNDHQILVEARLIRESAAPGVTKHKRMLVFEPSFQELLAQLYEAYPEDLILPGWELEFECTSDCSHDHTKTVMSPSCLRISCLECPRSADGDLKEWDLSDMEEYRSNPSDKEWRKFLRHLDTARHRQYVNKRLDRITELGR